MSYEKLTQFIYYCRAMQEFDLDVIANCTSPKGFGKSSFGIQGARKYVQEFGLLCNSCKYEYIFSGKAILRNQDGSFRLNAEIMEPCPKCESHDISRVQEINFDQYLAYDAEEVKDKIFDLPPYSPMLPDEGARFMMGEDWMRYENKEMKKLFAQMRTKHLLMFTNIQKFEWTDRKIRDDMTTFWIRILRRGLAVLQQPDLSETKDPWHMEKFRELMGSYNYLTPDEEIRKIADTLFNKHPCTFDYFFIPKVPEEVYAKYLKARDKKVFDRRYREESLDQKDIAKIAAWNLINRWQELQGAIKISRFDRPTYKILEEFIFSHPKDQKHIVAYTTIRNWQEEVNRVAKK